MEEETRVATSQHIFISRRAACHSCALQALVAPANAHAFPAMSLLFISIKKNNNNMAHYNERFFTHITYTHRSGWKNEEQ